MTLPHDDETRGAYEPRFGASRDFVVVHLDLVDALDGSWDAAALMNRIEYRAGPDGWWTATRADMLAEVRMTEHRVKAAITLLRERRMVRSRRVSSFDPTLQWRPWYDGEPDGGEDPPHVMEPDADTVMEPRSVTTVLKEHEELTPPTVPPRGDEGDVEQPALLDVEEPPQEPSAVPAVVVPLDAEFDGFWAAYPRKVGKGAARKAWAKARRKASVEEIAAGFRAHLPGWAARKARGEERFIPHASTWLNEERWSDEAAPPERVISAPSGSLSVMVEGIARAAAGEAADPWEYARSVASPTHHGLDSRAPGIPALPANERNRS